ncbi:hypothetical protein C7S18_11865 [Ahniella affigens]|uniref:Peptidase MA-like domain-containing protein n=1 Tax=Ahniella affigens TaxID=2021234 RepID=A0A2P1PSM2_9GAMM|nr:hypothetical protein [Ahniella affigens]AVP97847.1 hypothetical protein C7S18_11865 [Ahniella affigens]
MVRARGLGTQLVVAALLFSAASAIAANSNPIRPFDVQYIVEPLPASDQLRVSIALGNGHDLVKEVTLKFDAKRFSQLKANAGLSIGQGSAVWVPTGSAPSLSYLVKVTHRKDQDSYNARMTPKWALFRGDKVFPGIKARLKKGARSRATMRFKMPADWTNVDAGYLRRQDDSFLIDNPERHFDRPVGWIIAGQVGTRRDQLGLTEVSVAAPKGDPLDRMDALTFINFAWPTIESAFGKTPPKILIAGAGDPMWRGGLSASNSLFLHSERPLVSENATSTLLHELTHVVTRIRGKERSDWIAEGIAEFYSIELSYRAGGMTETRYAAVHQDLRQWGKPVTSLRGDHSTGPQTARAVQLLKAVDTEIRTRTKGKKDLDDVTRILRAGRKVSTADFIKACETVAGGKLDALTTPLLR